MNHTPGPWTYDMHDYSFYVFGPDMAMVADDDPRGLGIARMRGVGRGREDAEQQANARLIASAPRLLEALNGLIGHAGLDVERIDSDDPPDAEWIEAIAAMKEAEGN